jgi:hypothetical protein
MQILLFKENNISTKDFSKTKRILIIDEEFTEILDIDHKDRTKKSLQLYKSSQFSNSYLKIPICTDYRLIDKNIINFDNLGLKISKIRNGFSLNFPINMSYTLTPKINTKKICHFAYDFKYNIFSYASYANIHKKVDKIKKEQTDFSEFIFSDSIISNFLNEFLKQQIHINGFNLNIKNFKVFRKIISKYDKIRNQNIKDMTNYSYKTFLEDTLIGEYNNRMNDILKQNKYYETISIYRIPIIESYGINLNLFLDSGTEIYGKLFGNMVDINTISFYVKLLGLEQEIKEKMQAKIIKMI